MISSTCCSPKHSRAMETLKSSDSGRDIFTSVKSSPQNKDVRSSRMCEQTPKALADKKTYSRTLLEKAHSNDLQKHK